MGKVFTETELKIIGTPQACEKTPEQVRALDYLISEGKCSEALGDSLEQSMYDLPEEIVVDFLQSSPTTRGKFIDYATQRALSGDIDAYRPYLTRTPTEDEFKACIDQNFRCNLSDYQKYGVAFMLAAKHLLVGDECGLGKTVELCATLARLKSRNRLTGFVICVQPDAAEQWQREILRFTGLYAPVIDSHKTTLNKLFKGTLFKDEEKENIDGVIIKHSLLAQKYAEEYLEKLHDLIDYNVCVLDESSVVKNTKTNSYLNALAFMKNTEYLYLLNATAFELIIDDLYAQFVLLSPTLFKNKTWVEDRFCNIQLQNVWCKGGVCRKKRVIVGYKNTDMFRSRVKYFYLARTREELGFVRNNTCTCKLYLKTPAMNKGIKSMLGRWAEVLNCPSLCEYNQAYLGEEYAPSSDPRTFVLPMDAKSLPKLQGLYDTVKEKWAAGKRHIVIYCYHTEAQLKIKEDLTSLLAEDNGVCEILSGQTKAAERQKLVDGFNDSSVNILITNICNSLNLSVGEVCIFYSVVTNPSRLLQIASRINRDTSAKQREYVVLAYKGEELSNILNAYKRSENKKKLLGDYADASTDILAACKEASLK